MGVEGTGGAMPGERVSIVNMYAPCDLTGKDALLQEIAILASGVVV